MRSLSGGMKRRLLVAKALAHDPPVLVLDEPTAGVDIELRRTLWSYVRALNARGVTVILTTHYLEEAEEMCDRIAIINHGEVAACEDTATLVGRLDAKTLVIRPAETLDAPPPALAARGATLRPDGSLAIDYSRRSGDPMGLLEAAREAGVGIRDFATEEPDLEDVFLALTAPRAAAPAA